MSPATGLPAPQAASETKYESTCTSDRQASTYA
jgi:hypothetical protein